MNPFTILKNKLNDVPPKIVQFIENLNSPTNLSNNNNYFKPKNCKNILRNIFNNEESYFLFFNLLNDEEIYCFRHVTHLINFLQQWKEEETQPLLKSENQENLQKNKQLFWIDCQSCSFEDMKILQNYFKFHEITIEDCINHFDQTEKWECFDNYFYFTIKALSKINKNNNNSTTESNNNTFTKSSFEIPLNPTTTIGLKRFKFTTTNNNKKSTTTTTTLQQQEGKDFVNFLLFKNCLLTIHQKPYQGQDLILNRIENDVYKKHFIGRKAYSTNEMNNLLNDDEDNDDGPSIVSTNPIGSTGGIVGGVNDDNKNQQQQLRLTENFDRAPYLKRVITTAGMLNNSSSSPKTTTFNLNNNNNNSKHSKQFYPSKNLKTNQQITPCFIFYIIFDCIVDKIIITIDSFIRKVNTMDENTISFSGSYNNLPNRKTDFLSDIGNMKKQANYHKRFVKQKLNMLSLLIVPNFNNLVQTTRCYEDNNVSSPGSPNNNKGNVNLINSSMRMNETLKKFNNFNIYNDYEDNNFTININETLILDKFIIFHLRDILDHLNFCNERLDIANDAIHESHLNYLTKLQMDIAEAGYKQDKLLSRISSFTVVYAISSTIAGVFGMNCKVPFQDENTLFPFFGILSLMLILVLLILLLMRKEWI
ncbi:hypothetical protein ABK040_013393 [Willaertia magna]